MIILDTNVVSELMSRTPKPNVVMWVDRLATPDVMITAITAAELMYGVARLPEGRRKRDLHNAVHGLLTEDFEGQVLPFDEPAAMHYADVVAQRERTGRPISMADAQIAAICRSSNAALATRNIDDFVDTGVETVNPWNG